MHIRYMNREVYDLKYGILIMSWSPEFSHGAGTLSQGRVSHKPRQGVSTPYSR